MSYKITIVRNSESLPSDASGARLWRSGIFAKYFFKKQNVSWIISSFDHYNKKNRKDIPIFDGYGGLEKTIKMLKTSGYENNVSLRRFYDHFIFGIKVFIQLCREDKPQIILCSYPTPDSSFACVIYGKIFNVPVILDIRDLWPDVLLESRSTSNKIIAKIVLAPYFLMQKISMRYATALIAANENFLDWGLRIAKRDKNKLDYVAFIPFEIPIITKEHELAVNKILSDATYTKGDFLITFAGTIGEMFEFDTLLELVIKAKNRGVEIKVILCGSGSKLKYWKDKFSSYDNVIFPGYIDSRIVYNLLSRSSLLLAPYKNFENFNGHLPNKFMEYCAAGRPLISSLRGLSRELIEEYQFGQSYNDSNSLWKAVEQYHRIPNLVEEHSANAKSIYYKKFYPSTILNKLEQQFDFIIKPFDDK